MTDRRLGIVLEAPPGDGSFVDHAVRVGERLRAEGVGVDVRVLDDRAPDPAWEAVLAHGAGTGDWARAFATPDLPVVLTDWPEEIPSHVTAVDWAWWQAAYCVAWTAARSGLPVALLAGPAVATQRRIARAVERALGDVGGDVPDVHFIAGFDDLRGAGRAWEQIAAGQPGLLISTGGPASEAVCSEARKAGWVTAGFARGSTEPTYAIASDPPGALAALVRRMVTGRVNEGIVHFGFSSGRLDVRAGGSAPSSAPRLLRDARSRLALLSSETLDVLS